MPTKPKTHRPRTVGVKHVQPRASNGIKYDWTWAKMRKAYLAANPLCVECEKQGRLIPAVDLDHIQAHKGDYERFVDPDNLQGLCRSCHSRKTVKKDGGFGRRGVGT